MKEKKELNIKKTLRNITIIVFTLSLTIWVIGNTIEEFKNVPLKCDKYVEVNFKYVPTGGLIGGIKKVETESINYDGKMKVCKEGVNIFGDKWLK